VFVTHKSRQVIHQPHFHTNHSTSCRSTMIATRGLTHKPHGSSFSSRRSIGGMLLPVLLTVIYHTTISLMMVTANSLASTTDMVWTDEFTALQTKNWNVASSATTDLSASGIQSFQKDNVAITGGDYCTITTKKTSSSTFTSGQIDSYNKVRRIIVSFHCQMIIGGNTIPIVHTSMTLFLYVAGPLPVLHRIRTD
jgi:hypothetical protein